MRRAIIVLVLAAALPAWGAPVAAADVPRREARAAVHRDLHELAVVLGAARYRTGRCQRTRSGALSCTGWLYRVEQLSLPFTCRVPYRVSGPPLHLREGALDCVAYQ